MMIAGHKGVSSRGVEPTPLGGRARRTAQSVKRPRCRSSDPRRPNKRVGIRRFRENVTDIVQPKPTPLRISVRQQLLRQFGRVVLATPLNQTTLSCVLCTHTHACQRRARPPEEALPTPQRRDMHGGDVCVYVRGLAMQEQIGGSGPRRQWGLEKWFVGVRLVCGVFWRTDA